MKKIEKYQINFYRPNKYSEPIEESATVIPTKLKGYVLDKTYSKRTHQVLSQLEGLDGLYSAVAAFLNVTGNSRKVITSITDPEGKVTSFNI